jgi:ketol-acid reductoisomerase
MELIKKGFEVLVENGYQPELAYVPRTPQG